MNRETLVFITNLDLDNNFGSSHARMLCYAKALSSKGVEVFFTSVYSPFIRNEKPEILKDSIFVLGKKGTFKASSRKALPVIKELNFIPNLRYLKQLYYKFHNYKDLIYLLYPSNFALSLITCLYLRAIKKNKVIIEKNELHLGVALNLPAPSWIKKLIYFPALVFQVILSALTDFIEVFFDGMICISTRMEKLYSKFYKNLIRIPILADTESINHKKSKNVDSKLFRICYSGTISEKRDGIFTLLKSLAAVKTEHHNIECDLYGSITNSIHKKFKLLISEYDLKDVVKYHGNYNNYKIHEVLVKHDLLILPRPLNLQTEYGFPTKLAEYMSSGVPVLSTKVSDVSIYIVDGKNGFLFEELNSKLLLDKLTEILNNRNRLPAIGEAGRLTALRFFSYSNYSNKLNDFLFGSNKITQ